VADRAYVQHLARGGELLRADRVSEAKVELEEARKLRPDDSRVLALLGLAYFRLGEYEPARDVYTALVAEKGDDAGLRLNLGLVHLKMGVVEAAVTELEKAHELDPKQTRTVGYLGLAYARKGEYAKAREAFIQAGQAELAREMAQALAETEAGHTVEPPASVAEDEVNFAIEKPSPATPPDSITPALAGTPAPAPAPAADEPAAPASTGTEPGVPGPRRSPRRAGVNAFVPTGPQVAAENQATPVSTFAVARLIRPDDGDSPFEVSAGNSLIIRVRGRLFSRTEGVVVSGGELAYEAATKRIRGKITDEPFGTDARPMFIVSGHGHLVALPRGNVFTALQLADDILFVREDILFAFEECLGWENGHVPGATGKNKTPVVQLRGEGHVAIRTRRPPLTVKLAPEKVLYVDAGVLAGWIGRVVPRCVAPAAGGDSSAPFDECSGEGVVLVEDLGAPEKPEKGE
jgi:uncharacterized protein (AIM24 family)